MTLRSMYIEGSLALNDIMVRLEKYHFPRTKPVYVGWKDFSPDEHGRIRLKYMGSDRPLIKKRWLHEKGWRDRRYRMDDLIDTGYGFYYPFGFHIYPWKTAAKEGQTLWEVLFMDIIAVGRDITGMITIVTKEIYITGKIHEAIF
jgi:hypothetical protein